MDRTFRISERQATIVNEIVACRLRIRAMLPNMGKYHIREFMVVGNELNILLDSLELVQDVLNIDDYVPTA